MQVELYYYDACPYCQRVLRALDELGLRVVMKNTLTNPAFRDEQRALTGRATVPMLKIDGEPMFESADIVAWLRANHDRLRN